MEYLVHGEMYGIVYSDSYLMHHGMPKRSGRYKYGSGKRPFQHTGKGSAVIKKVGGTASSLANKAKKRLSSEGRAEAAATKYKKQEKKSKALAAKEAAKKSALEAKAVAKREKEQRKAAQKSSKEAQNSYRKTAKRASSLTDEELNKQIERLSKEKRLRDLTDEVTATKVTKGQKYVNDIMKSAGKTILTTAAIGVGTYALNKALTGAAGKMSNPQTAKTMQEIAEAATKKGKNK